MPVLWSLNLIQSPKIWWYMCSHLIRPQMNWFLLSEPCFAGDSDQSFRICPSVCPSIRPSEITWTELIFSPLGQIWLVLQPQSSFW